MLWVAPVSCVLSPNIMTLIVLSTPNAGDEHKIDEQADQQQQQKTKQQSNDQVPDIDETIEHLVHGMEDIQVVGPGNNLHASCSRKGGKSGNDCATRGCPASPSAWRIWRLPPSTASPVLLILPVGLVDLLELLKELSVGCPTFDVHVFGEDAHREELGPASSLLLCSKD